MATAKVSKRTVDAMEAPAEGKRTWLWDDQVRGFGVIMSASGRKVYVVQYRVGGKSNTAKRLTIGTHGSPWTPDAARERALELLRVVETGVDPAKAEQLAAQNGYCESFNGKLRDELLNGEIFYTLREAQILIGRWRDHYNTVRPHSSIGYLSPAPEAILPRPASLPYASLRSAQQGDLNRRNSNLPGGPT